MNHHSACDARSQDETIYLRLADIAEVVQCDVSLVPQQCDTDISGSMKAKAMPRTMFRPPPSDHGVTTSQNGQNLADHHIDSVSNQRCSCISHAGLFHGFDGRHTRPQGAGPRLMIGSEGHYWISARRLLISELPKCDLCSEAVRSE